VHSGADLQASASAAAGYAPGSAKGYLGYVLAHSNGPEILPIMEAAVEARAELAPALRSSRDVLYLDLALENVVRSAAERGAGHAGMGAAAFVAPLLQNLALSQGDNEEVCYCLKAWLELPQGVRQGELPGRDEALKVRGRRGWGWQRYTAALLLLLWVLVLLKMLDA
jgi:alpha-glucan,water dikinase